jgi:hypothetical protein
VPGVYPLCNIDQSIVFVYACFCSLDAGIKREEGSESIQYLSCCACVNKCNTAINIRLHCFYLLCSMFNQFMLSLEK